MKKFNLHTHLQTELERGVEGADIHGPLRRGGDLEGVLGKFKQLGGAMDMALWWG